MQVQILSRGERTKEYAVIFSEGDEAFSGLLDFAEKHHVTSAYFTAIGALNKAAGRDEGAARPMTRER